MYASHVRAFVVHFVKLTVDFYANMLQMLNMFSYISCYLFT